MKLLKEVSSLSINRPIGPLISDFPHSFPSLAEPKAPSCSQDFPLQLSFISPSSSPSIEASRFKVPSQASIEVRASSSPLLHALSSDFPSPFAAGLGVKFRRGKE